MTPGFSRRSVIKVIGGTAMGLTLGSFVPAAPIRSPTAESNTGPGSGFRPNAYLEITTDDHITFWVKKCEMGQQIHTAIAAMVADELGVDLDAIDLRQATSDERFGFVGTGGSYAVPGFWRGIRPLVAAAREMLISAAAAEWEVPRDALSVASGRVRHAPSGKSAPFGALAEAASSLEVPESPRLRDRAAYRFVGKASGRPDAQNIVDGSACFGMDVRLPGMRYAAIARSPALGGVLTGFDRQAALAVAGVEEIIVLDEAVAVVANGTWAAFKGRDALQARWRHDASAMIDNTWIRTLLADAIAMGVAGAAAGQLVRQHGEPVQAELVDELVLDYEMPMAQHAAIEPVNATAVVEDGRCELWAPIQMASITRDEIAAALGMAADRVTVHTTLLGGSFGRKLERGFAIEAARIAASTRGPVQLVYTREDDMQHGGVRPPSHHRLRFRRDDNRLALDHIYAAASTFAQQDRSQLAIRGYDWAAALGAVDFPYAVDHLRVRQIDVETPAVPLNWWRGTYRNNHAFAIECAIDELAEHIGTDPLALRLALLTRDLSVETFPQEQSIVSAARLSRVLEAAADRAAYDDRRQPNRAVGIACHCYSDVDTYVAHAVDVSVTGRRVEIHKVVAAVDCGLAITPDSVRAQTEGSVVFGLNSALWGDVVVEEGVIMTQNFDDCRLMRMSEVPQIDVQLLDSDESPGGMGEPPLPSVTPAFLNAVARAGGPRIRRLPAGDQLELG